MYCSKCGMKNESKAQFCYKCGTNLNSVSKPIDTKAKSSLFSIKNIGIAIVLVVVIILFLSLGIYNPPKIGSQNNPYSINLGFQGTGYYNYSGQVVYVSSQAQLNNIANPTTTIPTTFSTTSVFQITLPTTSTYYTTTIPYYTTTIPQETAHGSIQNGEFSFSFYLLNGTIETWTFPITAYNYWLSQPRIDPIIILNDSITGKKILTWDYRSTITPEFFANVTPALTNGKTAGQFVAEVQDINSQLVNYSLLFENTSVYPAQLLVQGQGDCKDKGVLMASILEAGNIEANYGMKIQFVYVDADNLTAPRTANHLMLYITYANGTHAFLDTTHVLATSPYFNGTVDGWYYNVTCTMAGCQTIPICTGSVCDGVGYSSGSSTGFAYCSNGGVVGSDNLCHPECGTSFLYCSTGSSCYNNTGCISCPSGSYLGTDGKCYT